MPEPVYYCWFCDAHRVAKLSTGKTPLCAKCGRDLPEHARLERESKVANTSFDARAGKVRAVGRNSLPCFSLPG